MEMKTNDERLNEFKFNQHKSYGGGSYIPDDDYLRLSAVYDIDSETLKQRMREYQESNEAEARRILDQNDTSFIKGLRPLNIGFLGDSITAYRESYANIIRTALSDQKQLRFHDFAVSGARSCDLFNYLLPFILDAKLDVVHIMIGTNDHRLTNDAMRAYHISPAEYEKNVSYIVYKLQQTGCKLIISSIPPLIQEKLEKSLSQFQVLYTERDRTLYNHILKGICAKSNVIFNDMESVYQKYAVEELLLGDGIHLGKLGQRLMAEQVFPKLLDILKAN